MTCRDVDTAALRKTHLVVPPVVMLNTSAATILKSTRKRFGKVLDCLNQEDVLVWNSDSAASQKAKAKHTAIRANRWALRGDGDEGAEDVVDSPVSVFGPCFMHMYWAAVAATLKSHKVLAKLFYGCTLLRRGLYKRMLKKKPSPIASTPCLRRLRVRPTTALGV